MKKREFRDLCGQWLYCKKDSRRKSDWQPIKVPSNWYLQGLDHHGKLYYKRNFITEKLKDGQAAYLVFHGVDYFADIWLNDHYVGNHEGYFQRFGFNVTRILKGKNELVVRVNSPKEPEDEWPDNKRLIKGIFNLHDVRPGGWDPKRGQDKNTGGIWNRVELMITNDIARVRRAYLSTEKASKNTAKINCEVSFYSKKQEEFDLNMKFVPLNFKGREIKIPSQHIIKKKGYQNFKFGFEIKNPKLWETWDYGFPYMYKVLFEVVYQGKIIDDLEKNFGIRTFSVDKQQQWFVNGKRVFPRGTNYIPTQWLSEFDEDKIRNDLKLIKNCYMNAIRVHGHVNRKELYDACDREGILIYQDFALQWGYSHSKKFQKEACSQAKDMVYLFFNHPSIVVWCCHNEPLQSKSNLDAAIHRSISTIDKTRYIVQGSLFTEHAYPGWYYGHYKEFSGIPAGPLVTEFGAQALPNPESIRKFIPKEHLWPPDWKFWSYHNFRYEQTFRVASVKKGGSIRLFSRNSQNYQAELLKYAIETMRRNKYSKVTGLFQFMFVDPWPCISWSIVDYYRQIKKAYNVVRLSYQPILVSIRIMRRPLAIFTRTNSIERTGVLWDTMQVIWVTNDTRKKYKNVKLVLKVEDRDGKVYAKKEKSITIPKDASVPVLKPTSRFESIFNIKGILAEDTYVLRMELWYRGQRLSENFEKFRVVRRQNI